MTGLLLAGGTVSLPYALFNYWIRKSLIADSRVRLLFKFEYSDQALSTFFKVLFASNGFNLLNWILFGLSIVLPFRVRKVGERALLILALLPFVFLFYLCCFTANIGGTMRPRISGTFAQACAAAPAAT